MTELSRDPAAKEFRLGDGERGCLLLHGLTGTPAEMRPIGEALAAVGYTTIAPLLPGHGSRVEDLARTRWKDWYAAALEAWEGLGRSTRSRAVVGLSMGSLLSLHLAYERPAEVGALALLAPVLSLRNQSTAGHALWISRLPLLPRRLAYLAKDNGSSRGPARVTPSYQQVPLRALASMVRLQRTVRRELSSIHAPALILEGGRDLTVAAEAGATLERLLGSTRKQRIVFPESGHILSEGSGGVAVSRAIERFLAETIGGAM